MNDTNFKIEILSDEIIFSTAFSTMRICWNESEKKNEKRNKAPVVYLKSCQRFN